MENLFTQKEIVTAKAVVVFYNQQIAKGNFSGSFEEFSDSLLKPKRKKIVVEVEYNDLILTAGVIELNLRGINGNYENVRVKELPEVFTREDIKDLRNHIYNDEGSIDDIINDWLSERSKK